MTLVDIHHKYLEVTLITYENIQKANWVIFFSTSQYQQYLGEGCEGEPIHRRYITIPEFGECQIDWDNCEETCESWYAECAGPGIIQVVRFANDDCTDEIDV